MPTHAYSPVNNVTDIDFKQYMHSTIAVLAGISEQMGLDLLMQFDYSIDNDKFKIFLNEAP